MSDHPPASHHLPLRECFPDVWLASSANAMSIPLGLKITFSRNMIAVRVPDGWVLLNPVRLSEGAEAELLAKAPLKHAVRLGTFHGRDDRYYVDRFGVEFWGVPGEQTYPEPSFSREITEEGPFPIVGARVVVFKKATRADSAVCLPQHRLLVTCDSVQHYDHDPLISTLVKLVMYPMGFFTCSCRKQRMFRRASTRGAHPRPHDGSPSGRYQWSLLCLGPNRHAQERRGNGRGPRRGALVLEERHQLLLQIGRATILLRGLERVHRRAVVAAERRHELGGWVRVVEGVGVPNARYVLVRHAGGAEALEHVALHAPGHGAHEALGRGRRVGGADLEDLCHQRRVVRDPVAHHDATTGARHAHHLLGHVEGLGREHGAEDAHHEVERVGGELAQVASVALLEPEVRETMLLRAAVSGLDEVAGDVDAQHVRPAARRGQRRGAVSTAEIEHLEPRVDAEALDHRLAALTHALRDAGEVTLLPECLIRIHASRSFVGFPSCRDLPDSAWRRTRAGR